MSPPTGALARMVRATDVLLHPSLIAQGWDAVRRARLLLAFVLLFFPFVLHEGIADTETKAAIRLAATLAFTATSAFVVFLLRCRGALVLATHVFVGTTAALAFAIGLFTGAPAPLLGLGGLAFIALFVAERQGAVWGLITTLLTLSVLALRVLGLVAPRGAPYSPVAQAVDAATVCAFTSGFAWMFITSKQRVFEQMEEAKNDACAANRAKSDFLANMSHEIRTPMTAIMGFGDLLLDGELSSKERLEHVEIIRRNGKHLLGLIDDILDLSKIEAGKMTLEHTPCSPRRIIADVVSLLRVPALAKGLSLTVAYATAVPSSIHSDPTRLRQILMNLVSNAVKFTAKGGVVLTVRCPDPMGASPSLSFDVEDSGPGIPPDKLQQVFEPFEQADTTTTRKFGGTGLGLAISQRLAQALGGSLALSSTLGVGSKFTLTVATGSLAGVEMPSGEREAGASDPAPRAKRAPGLRGRVLLAEDGEDNQALLAMYLRRAGASVTFADNGRVAVEKALAARAAGRAFDLVLMDMQMPELDGYGATQQLRAASYELPIVALTAHAMAGDRDACLAAGCDDYLTKPIVRTDFTLMLERYLHATGVVALATANEAAGAGRALRAP
jgi:signal transduction histidine kinase/CheY-like chemotaxis protein